jgi:hypothetical protein
MYAGLPPEGVHRVAGAIREFDADFLVNVDAGDTTTRTEG